MLREINLNNQTNFHYFIFVYNSFQPTSNWINLLQTYVYTVSNRIELNVRIVCRSSLDNQFHLFHSKEISWLHALSQGCIITQSYKLLFVWIRMTQIRTFTPVTLTDIIVVAELFRPAQSCKSLFHYSKSIWTQVEIVRNSTSSDRAIPIRLFTCVSPTANKLIYSEIFRM